MRHRTRSVVQSRVPLPQHMQGSGLAIKQIPTKFLADAEIPRLQRRACVSPLVRFMVLPARYPAIVKAYATGCYSMKEIAQAFDIHYATVSRVVNKGVQEV